MVYVLGNELLEPVKNYVGSELGVRHIAAHEHKAVAGEEELGVVLAWGVRLGVSYCKWNRIISPSWPASK